jgi:hypothetical protein
MAVTLKESTCHAVHGNPRTLRGTAHVPSPGTLHSSTEGSLPPTPAILHSPKGSQRIFLKWDSAGSGPERTVRLTEPRLKGTLTPGHTSSRHWSHLVTDSPVPTGSILHWLLTAYRVSANSLLAGVTCLCLPLPLPPTVFPGLLASIA